MIGTRRGPRVTVPYAASQVRNAQRAALSALGRRIRG